MYSEMRRYVSFVWVFCELCSLGQVSNNRWVSKVLWAIKCFYCVLCMFIDLSILTYFQLVEVAGYVTWIQENYWIKCPTHPKFLVRGFILSISRFLRYVWTLKKTVKDQTIKTKNYLYKHVKNIIHI